MSSPHQWTPTHSDPLFIMAMDHRDSFGKTLFGVRDDDPTPEQLEHIRAAKKLVYDGLVEAAATLPLGHAGCLVDEQYGQRVIDTVAEGGDQVMLAIPVEASGHDWFTLQWGEQWITHVSRIRPAYAKVLVRDNPAFDSTHRHEQFVALAAVSAGLADIGVPFLYELLVPAADAQLTAAGGAVARYDTEIRPGLVVDVIAENQSHGIEPALWKVEGLETVAAAEQVAAQAKAGGRSADLIVLGRDAPTERLDHWMSVARAVNGFVGFAIGRSIWEEVLRAFEASDRSAGAADKARHDIAQRYLHFVDAWQHPAD